jgi:uncharacterized protein (DUF983 family)
MAMFDKHSKGYSIFSLKCPKCHEGDLFESPTFSFRKPFDMPDHCPVCGQNYLPEPGFYYGAMFISYGFTAWLCFGFVALFHWGLGWSVEASFALLLAVCAFFFVYIFRLARSIWINLMVKYDPQASKTK